MEQQYINKSSATGLAITKSSATGLATFIAFLAVSLVPSAIYPVQTQNTNSYEQYSKLGMPEYDNVHLAESDESKILVSFAQMILENSKEDDSEIAKITSDGFWEFHENF